MSPEDSRPAVSGSFRDRDGRVYLIQGRVFRGLSAKGLDDFRALRGKKFFDRFREDGRLVGCREADACDVPLNAAEKAQWAGFIEHPLIPVITYAYEWTFGMLKAAALLQLEITEAAYREDIAVKDATPYNIQFVDGRPVFIDIGSFEAYSAGQAWPAYRQFCEMLLFPLMLQAYKGVDFQPLMRAGIDGVPLQFAARLFSWRDRFRKGVMTNVWLQSRLDNRYAATTQNVRSDLKSAGFGKELILSNLRRLRKLVQGLEWKDAQSEWADYEEFHNYSAEDWKLKEDFVARSVADSEAGVVWDIGCNTGRFSRIAARHARQVLAMDQDCLAVERLYRALREEGVENIHTLVQDVADPSPNWGWRNLERTELSIRAPADLILCLALIHHVVISANIPLREFIDWLAGLAPHLVIEFVSRDDDKVQALLRNKDDKYDDYGRAPLESALESRYEIVAREPLKSGNRFLYFCRRRQ